MRRIDADALNIAKEVETACKAMGFTEKSIFEAFVTGWLMGAIAEAPTIDAVPVVRGECAKQFMPDCPLQIIEKHERRFICQKDDDFCSYGEKTEDKLCQDRT